mmetsp:Transcript_52390/g.60181  ORF Transcript_52390/g.60181 Transcript_52390/m.60181 type:complete len:89 (-) Transcript_52390:1043-1309(-)
MVDAAMVAEIMRSFVNNTGGTREVQACSCNPAQESASAVSSMITIMHNVNTNLGAEEREEESCPNIIIFDVAVHANPVSNDDHESFRE